VLSIPYTIQSTAQFAISKSVEMAARAGGIGLGWLLLSVMGEEKGEKKEVRECGDEVVVAVEVEGDVE
jgi:hypothetical protein